MNNVFTIMRKKYLAGLVLVAIIIFGVYFGVTYVNEKNPIQFKRVPEPYTELYFSDHLNLPKDIATNTPYSFSFTVHNHEQQEKSYVYAVFLDNSEGKQRLGMGTITLTHDESIQISQEFQVTVPDEGSLVTVLLNSQRIQFRTHS